MRIFEMDDNSAIYDIVQKGKWFRR